MNPTEDAMSQTPIGMDLRRIEEAMRLLAVMAINSDREVRDQAGTYPPPDQPDTAIGRLIRQPEGEAARMAFAQVSAHLAALVGASVAEAVRQRVVAEAKGEPSDRSGVPSVVVH